MVLPCLALTGPDPACPAQPCPALPCSVPYCPSLTCQEDSGSTVPLHVTTGGAELSDMASKGRYHEDVFGVMISAKAAQQTRLNLASKKAELLELAALVRSCDTAGANLSLSHGVCVLGRMHLLRCMLCVHAAAVLHAMCTCCACCACCCCAACWDVSTSLHCLICS